MVLEQEDSGYGICFAARDDTSFAPDRGMHVRCSDMLGNDIIVTNALDTVNTLTGTDSYDLLGVQLGQSAPGVPLSYLAVSHYLNFGILFDQYQEDSAQLEASIYTQIVTVKYLKITDLSDGTASTVGHFNAYMIAEIASTGQLALLKY